MKDCVFCGIARGEEEASIIYEDERCLVFPDLYPVTRGHVLVIPRQHAVHLHEMAEADRVHLFRIGCLVLEAQRAAGIGWEGANVFLNDGPISGQHVPHVHLHLLPRRRGDGIRTLTSFLARLANVFGRGRPRSELDALAERLRSHLSAVAGATPVDP
ncbi:MAG: HIT family protein [Ectothiorhodospiraceae bacterium]|nr:HIT family protein [Ectothiorhodospiraceae bacterium]